MMTNKYVWLIERFDLTTGNSDGVYVAGVVGGGPYYDTTGNVHRAKQFRWRWLARLWMWANPGSGWNPYNSSGWDSEWRITQHGFIWV